MSTRRLVTRKNPPAMSNMTSPNPMANRLAIPLQERFAIFDLFTQEMKDHPPVVTKIAPANVGPFRRSVKRVPVPLPPTVYECSEEDDFLEEAESTTACDDGSPVYASYRDKPLPLVPPQEKALPLKPADRNKALPPLPNQHAQDRGIGYPPRTSPTRGRPSRNSGTHDRA